MHRKPYVAELDVLLGQEDVVSNHLTGTAVRHWTMSVPDGNIYLMCKKQRAEIPAKFADKGTQLLPFALLHLNLAVCQQTLRNQQHINDVD